MYYNRSIVLLFSLIMSSFCFNPDQRRKNDLIQQHKTGGAYKQKCKIGDKCRECSFDELKSIIECQMTGNKLTKICEFYDGVNNIVDESVHNEPCDLGYKFGGVLMFFVFCVITGVISYLVRRSHKNFLLNQIYEKLTILKDK